MNAARDWLWHGTEVLVERGRKTAVVLSAVAGVLADEEVAGPAGDRFGRAFEQFERLSSGTRDRLTGEPYAYYWSRLAYELLQAVLQGGDRLAGLAAHHCSRLQQGPGDALANHLDDFGRLLLGAAVLEGVDIALEQPLAADTPLAVPGTPLTFGGREALLLQGVRDGRVRATRPSDDTDVEAVTCPVVETGGCELRLQPAVFNVSVSGVPPGLALIDDSSQTAGVPRLQEALALLCRLDERLFEQIRAGLKVVALRPEGREGELTNISHCDLPGAIALFPCPQPHELGNVLWHEFLHNRLFALEEKGWFLDTIQARDDLYSPWRRDHRPPHGVLHAVYVFTGVGRYWSTVADDDATPETVRELAGNRLLSSLYQVRLGIAMLRRHARFSDRGESLLAALEEEHGDLWRRARGIGLHADTPRVTFRNGAPFDVERHEVTVRDWIRSHLHRYGGQEHVELLEPLLAG